MNSKKIKWLVLVLGLLVVTLVGYEVLSNMLQGDGPQIAFDAPHIDFGDMIEGDVSNKSVYIYNQGNETLNIFGVVGSCGCTAMIVNDKDIQPGERGEIEVTFESKNKIGKIRQTISIKSNDPNAPYLTIPVMANVSARKL